MLLLPPLTANKAASLVKFSRSAPLNPGVILAKTFKSTSSDRCLFLVWTFSTSSLPLTSGAPTKILLSNLPGLNNAGSKISGLFVAAIIIIPSLTPKPSISTSNWFNVCSLSSWPPPSPAPLCLPTASISSMINIIHGAFFLACSNKSLTLEAPTPTNISTKSEPDILKKGTPASPAIAFARSVLPVPGGPTKRTPLGILAPISIYLLGCFKKSTISSNSPFSSSAPATSLNVTFFPSKLAILALLLPKFITPLFPPLFWACCVNINKPKNITPIISIVGRKLIQIPILLGGVYFITVSTPWVSCKRLSNILFETYEVNLLPSFKTPSTDILSSFMVIVSILFSTYASLNSQYDITFPWVPFL